ncbi:hypothetical protein IMZ48_03325 [Candidatus Bathyarchaeota archaeon]|nr:hypothetical protein [Candidatus Bathyarchaeota archaeon]
MTDHLCFAISRKRARHEVMLILRQWRKYGVRDIQVDRERNIIFARVGDKNCESPFPLPLLHPFYLLLCFSPTPPLSPSPLNLFNDREY